MAYPFSLRSLHWLMTAVIVLALATGVAVLILPRGEPLFLQAMGWHKSLGVTSFLLVALRAPIRLVTGTPPYGPPVGRFGVLVAGLAHVLIYATMIALPISGYLTSVASKHPVVWLGFRLPDLVPVSEPLSRASEQAHLAISILMGVLLAMHLAAAVWHKRRDDGVYERIWPA
jgi:cytochrome b561